MTLGAVQGPVRLEVRIVALRMNKLDSEISILPEDFKQGSEAKTLQARDVASFAIQQGLEEARARLGLMNQREQIMRPAQLLLFFRISEDLK